MKPSVPENVPNPLWPLAELIMLKPPERVSFAEAALGFLIGVQITPTRLNASVSLLPAIVVSAKNDRPKDPVADVVTPIYTSSVRSRMGTLVATPRNPPLTFVSPSNSMHWQTPLGQVESNSAGFVLHGPPGMVFSNSPFQTIVLLGGKPAARLLAAISGIKANIPARYPVILDVLVFT